jgi:ketosteroid isomerase-like protein
MIALLVVAQMSHAPRGEIQKAYDAWTSAYMRKDIDGLDRQLAPDFVQVTSTGARRDRIEFLGSIMRQFAAPGPGVTKFVVTINKLEPGGGVWIATITERASLGDRRFGQITRDGWRKSAQGWQVTSTALVRRLD